MAVVCTRVAVEVQDTRSQDFWASLTSRPGKAASLTLKERTLVPFFDAMDGQNGRDTMTPSKEQQSVHRKSVEKSTNPSRPDKARTPGTGKKAAPQDRSATPPGGKSAQRKAPQQASPSPAAPNAPGAPKLAQSPALKALQAQVMKNWAGPGFSLPPAPEQLPMPSLSLLAGRAGPSSGAGAKHPSTTK